MLAATRARYSTPRATIRGELAALRGVISPEKGADPFAKLKARQDKQRKEEAPAAVASPPDERPTAKSEPPTEQTHPEATDGDAPSGPALKSEAIKNQIIQMAGNWGYSYQTEKPILGGVTRVDLALKLGTREIACQIAVTTPIEKEVENLKHCLDAGFEEIALLCDATVKRRSIESRFAAVHGANPKVRFLTVRQFLQRLEEIWEETRKAPVAPGIGEPPKATPQSAQAVAISGQEKDAIVAEQLRLIHERMQRARE